MPRPTRALGRPDTPVIPVNWERDHGAVVSKTLTAEIEIRTPVTTPRANADLSYDAPTNADPVYAGNARLQALNRDSMTRLFGEEYQAQTGYLVVIEREEDDVERGAVIKITKATDATLLGGRRLVVAKAVRGSLRFERDLYCTDQALG